MLQIIKDQKFIYSGKDTVLHVQTIKCSECNTVYVRSRIINLATQNISRELGTISWDVNAECQVCNNHKYDLDNLNADRDELARIVSNTQQNKSGTTLRVDIPRGNRSTRYWNIIYNIGKLKENRFGNIQLVTDRCAIECTRCKHIKIVSDEDMAGVDKIVCNRCKQALSGEITENTRQHLQSLSGLMVESKSYDRHIKLQKEQDDKAKEQAETKKDNKMMRAKFRDYHPNMHMLTAYTKEGVDTTYAYCDICGTPSEIPTVSLVKLRKSFKCEGCLIQKENPNYLGIFRRNLKTTTKNGLVCVKDNGDKVDLKCNTCGKTYEDMDKSKFLLGKITCNNKENCGTVDVMCTNTNCYYSNSFRISDIERAKATGELLCKSCGINLFLEAKIDVRLNDHNIEVRQTLNDLAERVRGEVTLENSLARESKELYTDGDGCTYYNCRCSEHNQNCVLSNREIANNPHIYCNNVNNLFVDMTKIVDLKINREASYRELIDKKNSDNAK